MKAAYMMNDVIHVGDVPDPMPSKGQALVRTHTCGLCASDAHFLHEGHKVVELCRKYGGPYGHIDVHKPFVPGHEYVGEIVDYGPGSRRPLKVGTRVTSAPIVKHGQGREIIGYSHACPGGFGELMLLDEEILLEVPNAVDDQRASMIEPLAVGLEHARMGEPKPDDVALVIGCGAIGLGVIAGLKLMNARPIIACDLAANRRAVALKMGADIAIDPREMSPYGPIPDLGNRRPNLVYECAGRPGMLDMIMRSVGFGARIVMGGFCLEPEQIYVPTGQMRRLKVIFAAGEEQQDMELAMRAIADGRIDVEPWFGGRIGLNGVGDALERMKDPATPIRTVVDPRRM